MVQCVTAKTNKTATNVVKLSEHLGHGHTVWIDNFYNSLHWNFTC
jgi:hypothetical protein